MPSDIFIKTGSSTWSKLSKLFIKTASSTWSTAKAAWLYLEAGWTKVWPLSGIYSITSPYITSSSGSTTPISSGALRVGTTYYGKNGTWNANGWTIQSYSYKWIGYTNSDISDTSVTTETSIATYSGTVSYSIPATFDKTYLAFYVRANASDPSYNGYAESDTDYGRLYVVRQPPINLSASLSTNSPQVGTQISWSSSWDTTAAYLPEASRSTIQWYRNSTSSITGGTLIASSVYSYTPTSSDVGYYIYAVETCYNSGSDYDYGINTGVSKSLVTTNAVTAAMSNFTFSLSSTGSVTTPSTPSITRVSSTSNIVLFELGSSFPSDTYSYGVNQSGAAFGTRTGTPAQTVTTLNQWDSTGTSTPYGNGTYTYDTISSIESGSSSSEMTISTTAYGKTRSASADVSTTSGAVSWGINFSWSNASSGSVTYYSFGNATTSSSTSATVTVYTNSFPVKIVDITGSSDPTITINNVTAYDSGGNSKAGTAGITTSLTIGRPTATSGSTTQYYTYYIPVPVNTSLPTLTYTSLNIGGTLTFGVGSWSNNPTSYDLRLYRGTQYVSSGEYLSENAGNTTSGTHVITQADYDSGQRYFRTYAGASNAGGYSGLTAGTEVGPITNYTAPSFSSYSISPSSGTAGSTTFTASYSVSGSPTPSISYQWQYFSSSSLSYLNLPSTSSTYTPPSNFNTLYPNYGLYCLITATNSQGSTSARPSASVNNPVSAPSGGSVTLSGGSTPGSVITASTSGWTGSPTSYDVFITTTTSGTPTASSTRVASSNGSSSTSYTITSTDAAAPANIFRAFATASNTGGTSGTVQSSNTITATSGVSIPSIPTGVGLTGSGSVSWTAVSGATSYEIQFYTAQNSSGLNAAGPYTVTGISSSPYQLTSPYASPNNYARVQVRARNSAGASSYSSWVPSSSTYT